ncbi:MAG: DUF1667 domain-containing protein [Candidatus Omnitrophica bacterium]|nr:DUF1667 domain-containing protein [Candidatus Omnitrophota bacterium]
MIRKVTCIDCPKGCVLSVGVEGRKVVKITGNECPKGEEYAVSEIEDPTRILTSTVLAEGFSLRMVPVRTDRPIPKGDIKRAMKEIKRIRISEPVRIGDIIIEDFLRLGVDLIATRESR